jgi:hypothetical protein
MICGPHDKIAGILKNYSLPNHYRNIMMALERNQRYGNNKNNKSDPQVYY